MREREWNMTWERIGPWNQVKGLLWFRWDPFVCIFSRRFYSRLPNRYWYDKREKEFRKKKKNPGGSVTPRLSGMLVNFVSLFVRCVCQCLVVFFLLFVSQGINKKVQMLIPFVSTAGGRMRVVWGVFRYPCGSKKFTAAAHWVCVPNRCSLHCSPPRRPFSWRTTSWITPRTATRSADSESSCLSRSVMRSVWEYPPKKCPTLNNVWWCKVQIVQFAVEMIWNVRFSRWIS